MEVLLLPDQRLNPYLVFNQDGLPEPQLPLLTGKDTHLHSINLRSARLQEMARLNPKLKDTIWFRLCSNLGTDSILMMILFRPVNIERFLVRDYVFQNVSGIVGYLHLQSSIPDESSRDINTLEEKLKNWLVRCKERDVSWDLGHDIAKDFKIVVLSGDKFRTMENLEEALQALRDYVLLSPNNEACQILQQGPFPKTSFSQKESSLSETKGDSDVHNPRRCDDLCSQSSKRGSRMSLEREPLVGLSIQSRDASTLSGGSCEVKECNGKEPLQVVTPGSSQFNAEEKSEGSKHKEEERTYQNLTECSTRQEETGNHWQDFQMLRERDKKAAPPTMDVTKSNPPQAGGGGVGGGGGGGSGCGGSGGSGVGGSSETTRKEGASGLAPTSRKSFHNPDQNDDLSKGNAAVYQGISPAATSFSADPSYPKLLPTPRKNPNASLSTQDESPSTSSKANRSSKYKTQSHLQPAEVVSFCSAKEDDCGIRRKSFGSVGSVAKAKTVLLLGAKGSGKTCLINAVANFVFGVKSNSEKKLTVSDEISETGFSSTDNIIGYTFGFKDQEEDVALTLIDTPGLNDSSGNEVRDHVDSLKTFLANAAHKGLEIHCVAFVVQAHLVRLTSSERLVMDNLKTLFGQDISDHMVNLVTFADNQSKPPVVEALDHYGMSTRHCFNFNNSVFCGSSEESEKELDRAYWKTSHKSWKKCWNVVRDLSPLKANTMKSIQKELYATNLGDSAMRELQVEIKSFFNGCRKADYKKVGEERRRIWNLAHVVFHTLQENERGHYASVRGLVEQKLLECSVRGDGSQRDLHVLMFGAPLAVFESTKAIIEANMELVEFNFSKFAELSVHKNKKEGFLKKVKNYARDARSLQEEVTDAEKILKRIEDIVVSITFESVKQLIEQHVFELSSALTTRTFLMLFNVQTKGKYFLMVNKLLDFEKSRVNKSPLLR